MKRRTAEDENGPPFRRILVPIPSEGFPQGAVSRAMELARTFGSELLMLYIIEDNVMNRLDHASEMVLTASQREEVETQLARRQAEEARKIHFIRVKKMADSRGVDFRKYIRRGIFGHSINELIREEKADLVVMELRRDVLLRFGILNNCPVPIWLERGGGRRIGKIMGLLTNRAPNKLVPRLSARLAKGLGAELDMEYVVDTDEDENIVASDGRELLDQFCSEHEPDLSLDTHCVVGPFAPTARKLARKVRPDLIIVGRPEMRRSLLGLRSDDKTDLARDLSSSVLMIN